MLVGCEVSSQGFGGADVLPESFVPHRASGWSTRTSTWRWLEQALGRAVAGLLLIELVNYLVCLGAFPFLQCLRAGVAGF